MDGIGHSEMDAVGAALIDYQTALYGFLYRRTGSLEAAREVLQETNLAILRGQQRLDDIANFKPWAKTVAIFQLKKYTKANQRQKRFLVLEASDAELCEDVASEENDIALDALSACLARLPERKRNLVRQRYWQKESIEQIAAKSRKKTSAIAMALLRVRAQLRQCVQKAMCGLAAPSPAKSEETALFLEEVFDGKRQILHGEAAKLWIEDAPMQAALHLNAERFELEAKAHRRERRKVVPWVATLAGCAAAGMVAWTGANALSTAIDKTPLLQKTNTTLESTMKRSTLVAAASLTVAMPIVAETAVNTSSASSETVTLVRTLASNGSAGSQIEARSKTVAESQGRTLDTTPFKGTVVILI